ncbi:MAG: mannosyltransferase, partial [Flavobacteriaceae bacterium]
MASALLYMVFAYHLERTDFIKLLCLYGALFFFCAKLIQFEKWNFKFLLITGIVLRLVFLWAVPNLSQDYFRFIWDGELILEGINPYLQVPNEWISTPGFGVQHAEGLHQGMGSLSAKHYSNYPPLNQWLFAMCAF